MIWAKLMSCACFHSLSRWLPVLPTGVFCSSTYGWPKEREETHSSWKPQCPFLKGTVLIHSSFPVCFSSGWVIRDPGSGLRFRSMSSYGLLITQLSICKLRPTPGFSTNITEEWRKNCSCKNGYTCRMNPCQRLKWEYVCVLAYLCVCRHASMWAHVCIYVLM